jgi:hypothetical protein
MMMTRNYSKATFAGVRLDGSIYSHKYVSCMSFNRTCSCILYTRTDFVALLVTDSEGSQGFTEADTAHGDRTELRSVLKMRHRSSKTEDSEAEAAPTESKAEVEGEAEAHRTH